MPVHYGRRIWKPLVNRPLEFLGLKEKEGLEVELRKLSKEELKRLHQSQSFKIGSAFTGVFINGTLTCVFPSNAVGTAVNLCQLCVAIRTRRKIENAAREDHGAEFRKGEGRSSRIRHYVAGGLTKSAFAVLFLGQDDFFALAENLADIDLFCPQTDVELAVHDAADELFGNSFVSGVQAVGGLPASEVMEALGMDSNPTWDEVQQLDSVTEGLQAGLGIGVASEANVAILVGEAVVVEADKEAIGRMERHSSAAAQGISNHRFPARDPTHRKGE
jgi:hypothetical protein